MTPARLSRAIHRAVCGHEYSPMPVLLTEDGKPAIECRRCLVAAHRADAQRPWGKGW